MFKAVLTNTKILKDSIDTISQIIDEGLFSVNKNGIELIASDRAMVAVVELKINSNAFEEFNAENDFKLGLNLINFLTILKRITPSDSLEMTYKEGDNKFNVTIKGDSTRKFSIPLLELNAEEIPPVSQLEFSASAEIKSGILEQGIADADIIADSVIIQLDPNGLTMFAEGDSSKTELNVTGKEILKISAGEGVKSRYPLDYLKKMIRGSKLSENAKLLMGNEYPMKLEFSGDSINLAIILAPRVIED